MSLKQIADELAARGRYGDSELVHMSKGEVAGLQHLAQSAGGSLTINPDTGKPEAFFLAALLPTLLGAAAPALGAAATGAGMAGLGGLLSGKFGAMGLGALAGGLMNRDNPLMGALTGGLGGMGGASLGKGLMNVGAGVGAGAPAQAAGMVGQGAAIDAGSQAAMLAAQNAGAPTAQLAQYGSQAMPAMAPMSSGQQMMAGIGESLRNPAQLGQALGGGMGALKTGAMAAAPMMEAMSRPRPMREEDPGSIPEYDFAYNPTGYTTTGSEELRQFRPTFTRRAAAGGIMQLARGGAVDLEDGDFIVPADVTSFAGGGSTDAGMIVLAKEIGAEPIKGPGTGLSDDIPARIDGKQPARVANGEMLVRKPGKEGAKKLYAMMDNIREQATGKKKQIKPVNIKKALA
jgi:hypothetical protein